MFKTRLLDLKGCREREDRAPVLDRVATPRRKTLAVPDPVHLIDDGYRRIARQKKIAVQGMRRPRLDRAGCRNEGLRDHKAAKDALPANLRAPSAKDIFLDPFEIEDRQKLVDRMGHRRRTSIPHLRI